MRKSTSRLLFSGVAGALLGGVIIILVLSMVGAGKRAEILNSPNNVNLPANSASESVLPSASPALTPSTSPLSQSEKINSPVFKSGGFSYAIPKGYRVADKIMVLDEKNVPAGFSALTLTKGSEEQEEEYVKLINQLQEDRAATEAPQFLPGQTISISVASKSLQDSDARLAHGSEKLTTAKNITGTRYIRVEGLFPYDATYLHLSDDKSVLVLMNYGSTEPLFDETAYMAAVNSIQVIQ